VTLQAQECWPASARDRLIAQCGIRFGRMDKIAAFREARKAMLSLVGRDHAAVRYQTAYGFKIQFPAWDANVVIAASNGRILHPRLTEIFAAVIQKGETFVDAGANAGFYSLLAAKKVAYGGRVISFEPDPRNLPTLRSNVKINHLESLIRVVPKALGDREGELDFWRAPENSWAGSIVELPGADSTRFKVSATTLDHYITSTNSGPVDVIKIDIEGAEPMALRGMRETLRKAKLLVYEINKPRLDQLKTGPLDLIRQTSEWGQFETTLITDERTDEILALGDTRSTEVLESYGWANVVSAKGSAVEPIRRMFGT